MYTYTSMERIQRKETYLWTEKWNMGSSPAMTSHCWEAPGGWKTTQEKNYIHSKMGENWDIYIYLSIYIYIYILVGGLEQEFYFSID